MSAGSRRLRKPGSARHFVGVGAANNGLPGPLLAEPEVATGNRDAVPWAEVCELGELLKIHGAIMGHYSTGTLEQAGAHTIIRIIREPRARLI